MHFICWEREINKSTTKIGEGHLINIYMIIITAILSREPSVGSEWSQQNTGWDLKGRKAQEGESNWGGQEGVHSNRSQFQRDTKMLVRSLSWYWSLLSTSSVVTSSPLSRGRGDDKCWPSDVTKNNILWRMLSVQYKLPIPPTVHKPAHVWTTTLLT